MKAVVGANVPNYRGMFLRGHGSQNHTKNNGSTVGNTATTHASGNLGVVQGDAVRGYSGTLRLDNSNGSHPRMSNTGVFVNLDTSTYCSDYKIQGVTTGGIFSAFINSRSTPTANEIRPANMAVKYIICAKE